MLHTSTVCYGRVHENDVASAHVEYQHNCREVAVEIHKCALVVDKSLSWLVVIPERIVIDPSEKELSPSLMDQWQFLQTRLLGSKMPFLMWEKTILEATWNVSAFCSIEQDGCMFLSESHTYFYQVQTEMHVTNSKWCDFVVWLPLDQPSIQQVCYDPEFMSKTIVKAQKFYFDQFLPAVLPYICNSITTDRNFIQQFWVFSKGIPSFNVHSISDHTSTSWSWYYAKKWHGNLLAKKTSNYNVELSIPLAKQPALPVK